MNRLYKYIGVLLCLLFFPKEMEADARLDRICFERFATPEGLPNNVVKQVYQDRDGYIWIATAYGLSRYDGYGIRTLKSNLYTPGRLPSNNVICVAEDTSRQLWIGTHEGACVMDKRTGNVRAMTLEGVSKQRTNNILVTHTGRVYLGSIRGVAYYDEAGDSLVLMTARNSKGDIPVGENIQALLEDENGDVLIGTWNRGLLRLRVENNEFISYGRNDDLKSVLSLFRDTRGTLWVGTNGDGLFKVRFTSDLRGMEVTNFRHKSGVSASLASDYVQAVHEDLQTASLWIGTRGGLSVMPLDNEGYFINYNGAHAAEHRLPVREITSVLRDTNGLMWLGSEGTGVFYADMRLKTFQTIGSESQVNMMLVDGTGGLWTGGNRGVGYMRDAERRTFFSARRPRDIVYSHSTNEVLLAIQDEGLIAYQDGHMVRQYKNAGCGFIPSNLVFAVREDRKGNWWIGSYKGLGVRYRDGRECVFGNTWKSKGIPTGEITNLVIENDTSLWMATGEGEVVHVSGNLEMPDDLRGKSYKLPVNLPLCFFIDRVGRIWVGTEGGGLCLYNARTDCFESVHHRYNLPGDMVGSIEEDGFGNLWLGTNCGLARLTVTGEKKGRVRTFSVADGLPDNFFNPRASYSKDGNLYFGCSRGIVMFDPAAIEETAVNLMPRITDIQVDGLSWEQYGKEERERMSPYMPDFTSTLQIPANHTNFGFQFAMLTYNHSRQNRYAYRLKGLEEDWHYTDAGVRTAHYTRIPSGTYTFELRAANANGEWSDVHTLDVVVEPPFWATGWAYLIYIIGALVTSGFILDGLRRLALFLSLPELYKRMLKQLGRKRNEKHTAIEIVAPEYTDADEVFLQRAVDCVNNHLDDSDFGIPCLVEELGTSRTTLHTRLKALTGLNATGFVRSVRLKAARRLIEENPAIRISDLAYRVGFNDPKYFSNCFKKEFGVYPSEAKNFASREVELCSEKEGGT